jgi:DNA repair exonuclease SbcCD ATPase subunit
MLVKRIQLTNFMKYKNLDLEFPDHGIILVTGRNGSGKSSLQEAVSVAYWGKTLRKTPPWQQNTEGSVVVSSPTATVTRKCTKKGSASLSFLVGGKAFDKRKYNTPTKAQAALDKVISMPWDLWRRTHVFSPTMAAHFTTAKDSDRKRLIESFLGLEMYDNALKLCRDDLKIVRDKRVDDAQRLSVIEGKLSVLATQRDDAKRAVELAQRILNQDEEQFDDVPTAEVVEAISKELVEVRELLRDSDADIQKVSARFLELDRTVTDAEMRLRIAEERTGDLTNPTCPTCGQLIPKEQREAVENSLKNLHTQVVGIRKHVSGEKAALAIERDDLDEELSLLRDRASNLASDLRVAQEKRKVASSEAARERRETAESNLGDSKERLSRIDALSNKLRVEKNKLAQQQIESEQREEFLEVVERVLGLRGVRVQVLARALEGINDLASYWLAQITNNREASLKLRPYSETKTAGITDALSLEVSGFGGGYGYNAASSGERRRIDVPITMALATVADAALGAPRGTLWMDEIFDNLDDHGVEAVAGALDELSQDRPVVVISHSLKMVERLKPILHIHVDEGEITIKS